jgi:hypothetical protein
MQLSDATISDPVREYEITFVRWGTLTKPAVRRTAFVLASDSDGAKRILRNAYRRAGDFKVVRSRDLFATAT